MLDEAYHWAETQFGAADLGDARRTDRLVSTMAAIAKTPEESLPRQLGVDPTATLVANSDVGDRCGFHGISRRYSCFRNTNKRVVLEAGWYGWGIRHQCQQLCHQPPISREASIRAFRCLIYNDKTLLLTFRPLGIGFIRAGNPDFPQFMPCHF